MVPAVWLHAWNGIWFEQVKERLDDKVGIVVMYKVIKKNDVLKFVEWPFLSWTELYLIFLEGRFT